MLNLRRHFDLPSVLVIVITLMLFAFALFWGPDARSLPRVRCLSSVGQTNPWFLQKQRCCQ